MLKTFDSELRQMKRTVMALRLPLNSRRSILGQLRTLPKDERKALYRKVIKKYGGNADAD